jgi:hypothetical protein
MSMPRHCQLGCLRKPRDQKVDSLTRKLHELYLGSLVHDIPGTREMLLNHDQTIQAVGSAIRYHAVVCTGMRPFGLSRANAVLERTTPTEPGWAGDSLV